MCKSTISTGPFSIGMLNYRRVVMIWMVEECWRFETGRPIDKQAITVMLFSKHSVGFSKPPTIFRAGADSRRGQTWFLMKMVTCFSQGNLRGNFDGKQCGKIDLHLPKCSKMWILPIIGVVFQGKLYWSLPFNEVRFKDCPFIQWKGRKNGLTGTDPIGWPPKWRHNKAVSNRQ